MTEPEPANRRPLASRSTGAARALATLLLRTRATPDQISAAGLVAAAGAAASLAAAPGWPAGWIAAAVLVQLRLLANLLDGMVAVEGGRASPLGPLWNEAPDRIEDALILGGFGVAAGAPMLGLAAVAAAFLCAYVRVLGGALGQPQDFVGPMAKQHRMAAVTLGCVLGFGAALAGRWEWLPGAILALILAGTLLTAARRLARLAARMRGAA